MRPVCVPCGIEMHCLKNGVMVKVYENSYYSGDKYQCPVCGHEAIVGFGAEQIHSTKEFPYEVDLSNQV